MRHFLITSILCLSNYVIQTIHTTEIIPYNHYPAAEFIHSHVCTPHTQTLVTYVSNDTISIIKSEKPFAFTTLAAVVNTLHNSENKERRLTGTMHSERDLELSYPYTTSIVPELTLSSRGKIFHSNSHNPFLLEGEEAVSLCAPTINLQNCYIRSQILRIICPSGLYSLSFVSTNGALQCSHIQLDFTQKSPTGNIAVAGCNSFELRRKASIK